MSLILLFFLLKRETKRAFLTAFDITFLISFVQEVSFKPFAVLKIFFYFFYNKVMKFL